LARKLTKILLSIFQEGVPRKPKVSDGRLEKMRDDLKENYPSETPHQMFIVHQILSLEPKAKIGVVIVGWYRPGHEAGQAKYSRYSPYSVLCTLTV